MQHFNPRQFGEPQAARQTGSFRAPLSAPLYLAWTLPAPPKAGRTLFLKGFLDLSQAVWERVRATLQRH